MKDLEGLAKAIADASKAVLPLIVPGSAQAIEAGEKMLALIEHAQGALDGVVPPDTFGPARERYEAAVLKRVDDTVDRLRG